jgi:hypothetical protein
MEAAIVAGRGYTGDPCVYKPPLRPAGTANVRVDIYNPSGTRVSRTNYQNVTFTAGQAKVFNVTWDSQWNAHRGTYRVSVRVMSLNWASQLAGNANAATFTVR